MADLVVECHSSVHMHPFLFIVRGSLHHVLWIAEQGQVHQLVIQTVLLYKHNSYKSTALGRETKSLQLQ